MYITNHIYTMYIIYYIINYMCIYIYIYIYIYASVTLILLVYTFLTFKCIPNEK